MGLVKTRRLAAMQARAHLKSKMQNRWAIVVDAWDVGLI